MAVDNEQGTVTLKRGKKLADEPLPLALIPPEPLPTWVQRDAVLRFAKNQARYPALVEILERRPPRARLVRKLEEAELSLDGSYLFVQGPPGSGKTWNGARMAIALMKAGQRVGITALSHKAIHKFLEDLEEAAHERGYRFRGMKKCGRIPAPSSTAGAISSRTRETTLRCWTPSSSSSLARRPCSRGRNSTSTSTRCSLTRRSVRACRRAGGRDGRAQPRAARRPEPATTGLARRAPAGRERLRPLTSTRRARDGPADMGIFLEHTWRMRPEVNAYVSETFYEGGLSRRRSAGGGRSRTARGCASLRSSTTGTGRSRPRRRRLCAMRSYGYRDSVPR